MRQINPNAVSFVLGVALVSGGLGGTDMALVCGGSAALVTALPGLGGSVLGLLVGAAGVAALLLR